MKTIDSLQLRLCRRGDGRELCFEFKQDAADNAALKRTIAEVYEKIYSLSPEDPLIEHVTERLT